MEPNATWGWSCGYHTGSTILSQSRHIAINMDIDVTGHNTFHLWHNHPPEELQYECDKDIDQMALDRTFALIRQLWLC